MAKPPLLKSTALPFPPFPYILVISLPVLWLVAGTAANLAATGSNDAPTSRLPLSPPASATISALSSGTVPQSSSNSALSPVHETVPSPRQDVIVANTDSIISVPSPFTNLAPAPTNPPIPVPSHHQIVPTSSPQPVDLQIETAKPPSSSPPIPLPPRIETPLTPASPPKNDAPSQVSFRVPMSLPSQQPSISSINLNVDQTSAAQLPAANPVSTPQHSQQSPNTVLANPARVTPATRGPEPTLEPVVIVDATPTTTPSPEFTNQPTRHQTSPPEVDRLSVDISSSTTSPGSRVNANLVATSNPANLSTSIQTQSQTQTQPQLQPQSQSLSQSQSQSQSQPQPPQQRATPTPPPLSFNPESTTSLPAIERQAANVSRAPVFGRNMNENSTSTQAPIISSRDSTSTTPLPSTTTSTTSTPSTVQFLKPKIKFKCQQPTDCLNGGICFRGACFCQPGFTGESCAINIDECRQIEEPCFNNGTCIDDINLFKCDCQPGFRGDRCQDVVDMCVDSSVCMNGARCINHRTDYTCKCAPGWQGRNCELNIDECLKGPCQNNATCIDLVNDYRCDCGQSGFTGKNCEIDFDDCAAKPCSNGAKECVDLTGDFKCICHDGFTGKRCEVDTDECQPNPCENNGTCVEKSQSILHLHELSSSHSNNLSNTDLIFHELGRDQHNLSSASLAGLNMSQYAGFTCECKEEFFGDRCEEKKRCYTKSVFELCNHQQAECVNVGSSYECLINASFDGSGQNYATYKVNGEFKMREIYVKYRSLTGGIIMSFVTNQADSPIADLQLNKSGLYLSGAPIKRDENIKFDELLDGNEREIRLGLDTPTEIKSITLTRQNTISETHSPFKGCIMQVRLNNQLVPLIEYGMGGLLANHTFEIVEDHLEVGQCRTCFEKDCLNGGHCEFQEGYDHCVCPDTFTGNFCELDINECDKNFGLCLNGGSCENLHGSYRCNCKEGFRGEKCQEISDYCKAKQPCVTGTCKNVNTAQNIYLCECPSSHIGKRCDRKRDCINECHTHHAQCINNVTCACLPGRRDERIMCEYVASCEQVEGELCLNGGTCKNTETGGYQCLCQEHFHGPVCQFLVEKPQFDVFSLIVVTFIGALMAACAVVSLVIFRSVRKARATRGTYSPSTQEKFGNSACDLLKPPIPERLI